MTGAAERTLRRAFLVMLAALLTLPLHALADSGEGEEVTRVVTAGITGGRALLELEGQPLRTMTPTPFRITLMDDAGMEVRQAKLDCELTMPAMPMPENRPEVAWDGERYRGEAIFTMAGAWRMSCRVHPLSGTAQTLHFDIEQVLLK